MGKNLLDEEIRDTTDHTGVWIKAEDFNDLTFFVDNQLDESVDIEIKGARIEDVTIGDGANADTSDGMGSVTIGTITVSSGDKDYDTLTDRFDALRVTAVCTASPTSGSVMVQLMGGML